MTPLKNWIFSLMKRYKLTVNDSLLIKESNYHDFDFDFIILTLTTWLTYIFKYKIVQEKILKTGRKKETLHILPNTISIEIKIQMYLT